MHRAQIAYPLEYRLTMEAAQRNTQAVQADFAALESLNADMRRVIGSPESPTRKFRGLREIANRMANVINSRSACRAGCAHCCHIAVAITSVEAGLIGQEIGCSPAKVKRRRRQTKDRLVETHFGVPCPFLENERCGIYESRPLACRLHFNIGHSPFFCSAKVDPTESVVPNIDFSAFWAGVAYALNGRGDCADIREFFPTPRSKGSNS